MKIVDLVVCNNNLHPLIKQGMVGYVVDFYKRHNIDGSLVMLPIVKFPQLNNVKFNLGTSFRERFKVIEKNEVF